MHIHVSACVCVFSMHVCTFCGCSHISQFVIILFVAFPSSSLFFVQSEALHLFVYFVIYCRSPVCCVFLSEIYCVLYTFHLYNQGIVKMYADEIRESSMSRLPPSRYSGGMYPKLEERKKRGREPMRMQRMRHFICLIMLSLILHL